MRRYVRWEKIQEFQRTKERKDEETGNGEESTGNRSSEGCSEVRIDAYRWGIGDG
jgi:hypothetical protein